MSNEKRGTSPIHIKNSVHEKFKAFCSERNQSMTDKASEVLLNYLKSEDKSFSEDIKIIDTPLDKRKGFTFFEIMVNEVSSFKKICSFLEALCAAVKSNIEVKVNLIRKAKKYFMINIDIIDEICIYMKEDDEEPWYEINDNTIKALDGKISNDKLKLIEKDFRFSRKELTEKLQSYEFTEEEILIILDLAKYNLKRKKSECITLQNIYDLNVKTIDKLKTLGLGEEIIKILNEKFLDKTYSERELREELKRLNFTEGDIKTILKETDIECVKSFIKALERVRASFEEKDKKTGRKVEIILTVSISSCEFEDKSSYYFLDLFDELTER